MAEDKEWLGYVDAGELEATSKDFAEVMAQLAIVKLEKEKIEEEIVEEDGKEV